RRARDDFERALEIFAPDRKRHVGAAVGAGVLDYHVHDDSRVRNRAENLRREPGPILDAGYRYLALVLVERYARDEHVLHRLILLSDPRPLRFTKAGADDERHVVAAGKFYRAGLQDLSAESRHLEHFIVRDAPEFFRLRADVGISSINAVHVSVDFARVGFESGCERDRGQVRRAAAKRGNIAAGVDTLVSRYDNNLAVVERPHNALALHGF